MSRKRVHLVGYILLLGAAVLLVPPVRQRLFGMICSRLIDRDAKVSDVAIYPSRHLLVVEGLRWESAVLDQHVTVELPQTFLFWNPDALPRGSVSIVHGQSENVRVSLVDEPRNKSAPVAAPAVTDWQFELIRLAAQVDWREIQNGFRSLLTADHLNTTWSQRIGKWIDRSHAIMAEVRQVNQRVAYANPLRDRDRLAEDFRRADELLKEQELLVAQFDRLQRLLDAESRQLREQFHRELEQFDQRVLANVDRSESQLRTMAEQLLQAAASEQWNRRRNYVLPLARIVQRLSPAPRRQNDLFLTIGSRTWFDLNRLEGHGTAELGSTPVPFRFVMTVLGRSKVAQSAAGDAPIAASTVPPPASFSRRTATSAWRFELGRPADGLLIQCATERPGKVVTVEVWQRVGNGVEESTPSEVVFAPTVRSEPIRSDTGRLILQGTIDDRRILMQMEMAAEDIVALLDSPSDGQEGGRDAVAASDALQSPAAGSATVQLVGSWDAPRPVISSSIPEWLTAALKSQLKSQLLKRSMVEKENLRQLFNQRIALTTSLVQKSAEHAREMLELHHQEMLALHQSIRQYREALHDSTFARRPQGEITR